MKTTLNPFENAKRTAQGTGGVSPSVINEIQAEITVLGSQNETQAQDITDIKAQLTELAGAYSTTEHKTGRKDIDGRDIYERTFTNVELKNVGTTEIASLSGIYSFVKIWGTAEHNTELDGLNARPLPFAGSSSNDIRLDVTNNKLRVVTFSDWSSYTAKITIEYTKTGA